MAGIRTSAGEPLRAPVAALLAGAAAANLLLALVVTRASPSLAVAGVAVVGVLALAVLRPEWTLVGALFMILSSAELLDFVTLPNLAAAGFQFQLTDLLLVLAFVAWIATEVRDAADERPPLGDTLAALLREPFAWGLVPLLAIAAVDLARGGQGTLSSARIFLYVVAVPVVMRLVDTPQRLRVLALTVVAAAAASSIVGIAMVAAGRNLTADGLSTGGLRGVSIRGSIAVASALLYVVARTIVSSRPLGGLVPVLLLLFIGGVAAAGARETWVGLAAALVLFVVVSPLGGFLRVIGALVLALGLGLGAYSIVPHRENLAAQVSAVESRLTSLNPATATQDPSVTVRFEKWNVVWQQFRQHPVFGTGFGYPATYTSNIGGNNFQRSYVDDPENTQLWLWARMGTVGFASWILFNVLALGSLLVLHVRRRDAEARAAALWGAGTLVVIWAGMTFSPVSAFASVLLLFWVAIALAPVVRRLA